MGHRCELQSCTPYEPRYEKSHTTRPITRNWVFGKNYRGDGIFYITLHGADTRCLHPSPFYRLSLQQTPPYNPPSAHHHGGDTVGESVRKKETTVNPVSWPSNDKVPTRASDISSSIKCHLGWNQAITKSSTRVQYLLARTCFGRVFSYGPHSSHNLVGVPLLDLPNEILLTIVKLITPQKPKEIYSPIRTNRRFANLLISHL